MSNSYKMNDIRVVGNNTIKTRDFGGEYKLQNSGFMPDEYDKWQQAYIVRAVRSYDALLNIAETVAQFECVGAGDSCLHCDAVQILNKSEVK